MRFGCSRIRTSSPQTGMLAGSQDPEMLKLHLHDAQLVRSFSKFGIMDLYVVVSVEEQEVHRTSPARWAHKSPQWDSKCTVNAAAAPSSITLAVWNANRMRRDVFCGSVTIPCCSDMELLEKEFALTKRGAQTGTVRVSLEILGGTALPGLPRESSTATVQSVLGAELDNLSSWLDRRSPKSNGGSLTLSLAEPSEHHAALGGASQPDLGLDGHEDTEQLRPAPTLLENRRKIVSEQKPSHVAANAERADSPKAAVPQTQAKPEDEVGEVLCSSWTCVATTGLEEFLKHTGIGAFQRKLAMAARWPAWEFSVAAGNLHFLNHSAMGDLHEDIRLDGQTYQWRDGRGNLMTCTAQWEKTADGGILRISRTGAIATYSEERHVSGDTLAFSLVGSDGATWGRVFKRA